ncbi:hypothetical protein SAMN02745203_00329 [Porphyromonas crevioricanis]|nr:hypothetical protein SAMN02745203_00329 [Porphyromonas crevioricanis]
MQNYSLGGEQKISPEGAIANSCVSKNSLRRYFCPFQNVLFIDISRGAKKVSNGRK